MKGLYKTNPVEWGKCRKERDIAGAIDIVQRQKGQFKDGHANSSLIIWRKERLCRSKYLYFGRYNRVS